MDDVKLEQANSLQKNLKVARANLSAWKTSKTFTNSGGAAIYYENEAGCTTSGVAPVSPETFTVLKALNIQYWAGIVAQIETEYNEL